MTRGMRGIRAQKGKKSGPYNICFEGNRFCLEPESNVSEVNEEQLNDLLAKVSIERPEHCPELVLLARLRLWTFELI